MKARYGGWCKAGRDKVRPGQEVVKRGGSWVHFSCWSAPTDRYAASRNAQELDVEAALDRAEAAREDYRYQQGLADGARYSAEKRIYGAALADRFQAMDEFNRYWKYGEE